MHHFLSPTTWLGMRRPMLVLIAALAVAVVLVPSPHACEAETVDVWIGTARLPEADSRGIYRATLDLATGRLTPPKLAAEIDTPGFLVLNSAGTRLYSTCRLPNGEGGVAAFEIADDGDSLRLINTQPTGDGEAAHLTLDRTDRCLFTAQYGGGSVAAFPIGADGRIEPRRQLIEHEGQGPNAARQEKPHPHWVGVDPNNRFLLVPDLGIDQVVIYRLDADRCRLEPHGSGSCPPGSGPRHLKFHPDGRFAYVVNELDLSVTAFEYDAEAGRLDAITTTTALPEEMREVANSASEIRVHPNKKFLYTANRGHDSLAVFAIDPNEGTLTFVEHEAVRGSHPRNFNIDPTGRWLLAAGRDSNTISLFSIAPDTGELVYAGRTIHCPAPICIEFQAADPE